jgi:hypothetical protein
MQGDKQTSQLNAPSQIHCEFLSRLNSKAESDPRIRAAWLEGSFGKNNADRYSDVDAHLLIAEEHIEDFRENAQIWLSDIRPLVLFNFMFQRQMINCLTKDGLRVDVWLHPGDSISVDEGRAQVLFHREGSVSVEKNVNTGQQAANIPEAIQRHIGEFWRCIAITPTVLGRGELITSFMGVNIILTPLTEILIIANRMQRDRGVKNLNQFLPPDAKAAIEQSLTVETLNQRNLARAHLRLARLMQQRGPGVAEQFGVVYPRDLEEAVIRYVCKELRLLGLDDCLEELHRRFD